MSTLSTLKVSQVRKRGLPPLVAFVLLTLVSFTVSAQRRERLVDTWKPLHYDVAIAFDDQLSEITSATTKIQAAILKNNVRKIDLDFGELNIDSVIVGDQPAQFERKPGQLDVVLAQPVQVGDRVNITVTYHGRPKDGLILAKDRDGKPSATGDNWPTRVHEWIPCLDHPSAKATVTFSVAALPKYLVVANGKSVFMTRNGGAPSFWRFEETKPIPPYCMIIVVNEGARIEATDQSVTPLSYYVPQRDRAYAPKGFAPAAPALAFFNETVGPYPYEKLALIIGATRFGGMENSSAIVFTSSLFDPRANDKVNTRFGIPTRIENVVAHEVAHQWFGDSVTGATWADLWLSEGFATYFAGLFIEKYDGQDAFQSFMRDAAEKYFAYEQRRRAPIYDTETEDLNQLLNPNNYEKGAWVLHMLRTRLGNQNFFRGLRTYYQAHRDATATTEDLRAALEKASSQDLKEFFARWVYGEGHPHYEASSSRARNRPGWVTLVLSQTQDDEVFLDPVVVEIATTRGEKRLTIHPRSKTEILAVPIKGDVKAIRVDPDDVLLNN
jgi:aminopeptidase N